MRKGKKEKMKKVMICLAVLCFIGNLFSYQGDFMKIVSAQEPEPLAQEPEPLAEEAALLVTEHFEAEPAGTYKDSWLVGGNQVASVTEEEPLIGKKSLVLKNNTDTNAGGANGLYVQIAKQFGNHDIVLRIKRGSSDGGVFRIAQGEGRYVHESFRQFSKEKPLAYNLDGTANEEVAYNEPWEGFEIPADFDGYLFLKNTEGVELTNLSLGMAHNSFPANMEHTVTVDNVAAYTGSDYAGVIALLEENTGEDVLDIQKIADEITALSRQPLYGESRIRYPQTPDGVAIEICQSSNLDVVDKSGRIYTPEQDTEVELVFSVTDLENERTSYSPPVKVSVPGGQGISTERRKEFLGEKYGLFVHYVPSLTANKDGGKIWQGSGSEEEKLRRFAAAFDVDQFVQDVKDMKVEYVIFTAWHANMVALYPSDVMKNYGLANHQVSDRDLIGEIIDGLKEAEIDVYLYTHPRDGHDFSEEDAAKVGWVKAAGTADPDFEQFDHQKWNNFINDVYGELIGRYGAKISGLFVDEASSLADSYRVVDYNRLRATIKSGNPDLLLMQNFYGTNYSFDIGMKEYNYWCEFSSTDSRNWPVYEMPVATAISTAGWWAGAGAGTVVCKYSPEDMFRYTVLQSAANTQGGGIAWAAGPYPYGEGWEKNVKEYLVTVGKLLEPIRESVTGTTPSRSFPTKSGSTLGTVVFAANTSLDKKREYIHILNAPEEGNSISLGISQDGRTFAAAAKALNDGTEFTVAVDPATGEITLRFQGDKDWSKLSGQERLDYVVVLEVNGYQERESQYRYIDNTDTSIRYANGNWSYERWYRNNSYATDWGTTVGGDYEADIHRCNAGSAFFEVPFEGTGIAYMPCTNPQNTTQCDIYVDGVLVGENISLNTDAYIPQNEVFSQQGLENGMHMLRVVNKSEGFLVNDVLKVTQPAVKPELPGNPGNTQEPELPGDPGNTQGPGQPAEGTKKPEPADQNVPKSPRTGEESFPWRGTAQACMVAAGVALTLILFCRKDLQNFLFKRKNERKSVDMDSFKC